MNSLTYFLSGVLVFLLPLFAGSTVATAAHHAFSFQPITEPLSTDTAEPVSPWKTGGRGAVNFNQVSFVNWAAGGENSYSVSGLVHLYANLRKGKATWNNTFDIGYGVIRQAELGARKADDRVELMSKFGYHAINRWYYSGMVNFRTQMDQGFNYSQDEPPLLISDLMSPGYLFTSVGMEYKSEDDNFHILISPFTGKTTFVFNDSLSDAGAFGVEPGDNVRQEFGGFTKVSWKREVWTNVHLTSRLDLFSNYLDNPQRIDVNLEVILMMKINQYLVTTLTTNLIYDHDIKITDRDGNTGPRTQFKEVLAIGLSYTF